MKTLQAIADWADLATPTLMGTLRVEQTRGKEVFSFTYDSVILHYYAEDRHDHLLLKNIN
jgi:hypothetical protein